MSAGWSFLVYGSGDFGRIVRALVEDCGHSVLGLLDDFQACPGVLGSFDDACRRFAPASTAIALAIGYRDLPARWRAWQGVVAAGWQVPALVHPQAYVASTAALGAGTMVMAGAIVEHHARVAEACVLWPRVCVNHDAVVGANSFLSPGAILCGGAQVGAHSFVGAGAVLVDGARLPDGAFVKMGSSYTRRGKS